MKLLTALFFLTILYSCAPDKSYQQEEITGRWAVSDAYRDGRLTGTLKGGYFEFNEDNSFKTNVFGSEQEYRFSLSGSKIKIEGTDKVVYTIDSLVDDTLHLETWFKNYRFNFNLVQDTLSN